MHAPVGWKFPAAGAAARVVLAVADLLQQAGLFPDPGKVVVVFQQIARLEIQEAAGLHVTVPTDKTEFVSAQAAAVDSHPFFRAGLLLVYAAELRSAGHAHVNAQAHLDLQ